MPTHPTGGSALFQQCCQNVARPGSPATRAPRASLKSLGAARTAEREEGERERERKGGRKEKEFDCRAFD